MLQSLILDCKAIGHNITTLIDSRLEAYNPPKNADKTFSVKSISQIYSRLREISNLVDAVYVIAPESDQILEKLLLTVNSYGGRTLNCEINAIKKVSNKMKTNRLLKNKGLKVPETMLVDIKEKQSNITNLIKEFGWPMIFKPISGVGCEGLSIVKNENDVKKAIKKIEKYSTENQFIVQKLIIGEDASVCLFSNGNEVIPITLNQQLITLANPDEKSEYKGGIIPFNHKLFTESLKAAERAVKSINGLKGYVGVDMILATKGPVIVEINPRLTTSYIGLNRVINFNPAEALIDSVIQGKLPKEVEYKGYSFFSKIKVPPSSEIIPETFKIENVISPPFPTEGNKPGYSLIAASSNSLRNARLKFCFAKKRLLKLYNCD